MPTTLPSLTDRGVSLVAVDGSGSGRTPRRRRQRRAAFERSGVDLDLDGMTARAGGAAANRPGVRAMPARRGPAIPQGRMDRQPVAAGFSAADPAGADTETIVRLGHLHVGDHAGADARPARRNSSPTASLSRCSGMIPHYGTPGAAGSVLTALRIKAQMVGSIISFCSAVSFSTPIGLGPSRPAFTGTISSRRTTGLPFRSPFG